MGRPEYILDLAIIFGALIGIFDHQSNGRTGGLPFKHTRQNAYFV